MDLELVSFKTCPYVQRSVITLREKGVDFKLTYIDLDDPPQWFTEVSPLGKVPILRTERGVLFESAVINEYLDEITDGALMPDDVWERAQTRAWIEFDSQCLEDFSQAVTATDQQDFLDHLQALRDKLSRLEDRFAGPYFLGGTFGLADAAMAPLMMRLQALMDLTDKFDLNEFPLLKDWTDRLVERPSVEGSMVPEWRDLMVSRLAKQGSYVASEEVSA